MASQQELRIVGNVGGDPEMKQTNSGTPYAKFSVGVNERYTDGGGNQVDRTMWVRCTAWNKTAELVGQLITKGREVTVRGTLEFDPETHGPRIWAGNDGFANASFEMRVDNFLVHGPKPENAGSGNAPAARVQAPVRGSAPAHTAASAQAEQRPAAAAPAPAAARPQPTGTRNAAPAAAAARPAPAQTAVIEDVNPDDIPAF